MTLFLNNEELTELTGYQWPSKMIKQLKTYGIRFFVAADGYPRVPRCVFENEKTRQKTMPNLDAIRKKE